MAGEMDIKGSIVITDQGATATIAKVTEATTKQTEATIKQAVATKNVADTSKTASVNVGMFGSTVGVAAGTLGRMNSGLGQTVGVVGQALGSFQSLATAGLGPLGMAVGVVSTAVTAFTAVVGMQTAELERARVAMDEVTAASARYRDEQRRTNLELQSAQERSEASGTSLTTVTGRAAARETERQRLVERDRAREQQDMEDLIAEYEAQGRGVDARRGGSGGPSRLDRLMQGRGDGAADDLEGLDIESLGNEPEAQAEIAEKGADIEQQRYEEQLDRNLAYLEKREAQEAESAERLKAINDSVFASIEAGLSSSVDAWLSGSATAGEAALKMVKGVAKALTTEAIIQGLKETALGIGSAASYDYAGAAQHFASAATWAAVGVAAGAVGVASGAFGSSSGGGAAGPARSPQSGPALSGGSSERGGNVYNINIGASGMVYAATRDELGAHLDDIIGGARARSSA